MSDRTDFSEDEHEAFWRLDEVPPVGEPAERTAPEVEIELVCAASFAGREPPSRPWFVRDIIPGRQVTLVSGDGGVGKSLVVMQLAAAAASGTDWIGHLPEHGPVIYLSAEDELAEHHRRLRDIAEGQGFKLADLGDLHIIPLAGRDAVLGVPNRAGNIIEPTPLFAAVRKAVERVRPRLLVVDTLADAFAGNENDRAHARQFISLLRGMAIDLDLTVVVLAHPSLSGIASGSGTSGSTGWSNSVRSRLYLDRVKGESREELDPSLRTLKILKNNYAATGGEIRLQWTEGHFRPYGGATSFDRLAQERDAEDAFLDCLNSYERQGRVVSEAPGANYAPNKFESLPEARGHGKRRLKGAMEALFAADRITIDESGPPSRRVRRIVRIDVFKRPSNA